MVYNVFNFLNENTNHNTYMDVKCTLSASNIGHSNALPLVFRYIHSPQDYLTIRQVSRDWRQAAASIRTYVKISRHLDFIEKYPQSIGQMIVNRHIRGIRGIILCAQNMTQLVIRCHTRVDIPPSVEALVVKSPCTLSLARADRLRRLRLETRHWPFERGQVPSKLETLCADCDAQSSSLSLSPRTQALDIMLAITVDACAHTLRNLRLPDHMTTVIDLTNLGALTWCWTRSKLLTLAPTRNVHTVVGEIITLHTDRELRIKHVMCGRLIVHGVMPVVYNMIIPPMSLGSVMEQSISVQHLVIACHDFARITFGQLNARIGAVTVTDSHKLSQLARNKLAEIFRGLYLEMV